MPSPFDLTSSFQGFKLFGIKRYDICDNDKAVFVLQICKKRSREEGPYDAMLARLLDGAKTLLADDEEEEKNTNRNVLPTGTVTSHYDAALRYHASAEPLRAHLRERNHWSPTTFEHINLPAHGASIRKHMHRRTQIIKLVNGIPSQRTPGCIATTKFETDARVAVRPKKIVSTSSAVTRLSATSGKRT